MCCVDLGLFLVCILYSVGAINVLKGKLPSVPMATSGSVEYRSRVAENLLYKVMVVYTTVAADEIWKNLLGPCLRIFGVMQWIPKY